MQFAKPPDQFIIDEPDGVKAAITAYEEQWPRIQAHWGDIKSRLKQTGHREGTPIQRGPPGARLYIAEGDAASGLPEIKVAYSILGGTLSIRAVMVEPAGAIR